MDGMIYVLLVLCALVVLPIVSRIARTRTRKRILGNIK